MNKFQNDGVCVYKRKETAGSVPLKKESDTESSHLAAVLAAPYAIDSQPARLSKAVSHGVHEPRNRLVSSHG